MTTEYSPAGSAGYVAFATRVPGQILPVPIGPGRGYLIHQHGFLCATAGVNLTVGVQRSLGAGVFGGDGVFLAVLTGPGRVWLQTLTLPRLAHALLPYIPRETARETTEAGVAGAVLKNIFKND